MPIQKPKSNQAKNRDNQIIEPNTFLKTQKEHKNWYDANQMGKQRGKPTMAPKKIKKQKGSRKHSLRKEK